jgi:hypothetical protein
MKISKQEAPATANITRAGNRCILGRISDVPNIKIEIIKVSLSTY